MWDWLKAFVNPFFSFFKSSTSISTSDKSPKNLAEALLSKTETHLERTKKLLAEIDELEKELKQEKLRLTQELQKTASQSPKDITTINPNPPMQRVRVFRSLDEMIAYIEKKDRPEPEHPGHFVFIYNQPYILKDGVTCDEAWTISGKLLQAFAHIYFPFVIVTAIVFTGGALMQSLVPIAGISAGFLAQSLGASPSIVFSCSLLTQFVLRFILSGRPKKK